jgi:glycolate oxidase FAD binding subunit
MTQPQSQDELAALVRDAYESGTALYPVGGGTALDYGLAAKAPGTNVSLTALNRVIDFPARDLTITVEAGITMQALAELLATEGLRLPVDVPFPEKATLGGVIATGWSGPRRYGHGTIRDFVIGIRAVDGRGTVFNGGGRVVKNVAGYDFCKLLTGSMGTLAVIEQVTLKLRPLAQKTLLLATPLVQAEMLDALLLSEVTPVAVELLQGPAWNDDPTTIPRLVVGLEGTATEVEWMAKQTNALWGTSATRVEGDACTALWRKLSDFPAGAAPLVLKMSVKPSSVVPCMAALAATGASLAAHAGSGIVYARFGEFPKEGLSRTLIGKLQPLAASHGGHVVILSNPSGQESTQQSTWGAIGPQHALMASVKAQFDPRNILNPGRFVFA